MKSNHFLAELDEARHGSGSGISLINTSCEGAGQAESAD